MPRDRSGRTYRVRQILSHVSKDSLAELLVSLCDRLGPEENIIICSLASSLVPFETPRTKTATVCFKTIPDIFDNDDTEWVLPTRAAHRNLIVDVHFLGFTALNDVDSDLHTLDCISISGLASHPFGSWAERNPGSNFMWLRDRLPHDLKQVRSIIYGYDSRLLQSGSLQSIDDIAITFIAHLKSIGRSMRAAKPAVILAHSLGGIMLKCALLEMANSGDLEKHMLNSMREVIFFGVPNKGMEMEHWLPMVDGQPNGALIRVLSPGSQYIIDLDDRFDGISNIYNLRLVSFYETQRSQTAERNQHTGNWGMSGPFKLLVDKKSAEQRGSRKSDVLPINKSHSDMVKFREGGEEYQIVARYIHELIESLNNTFGSSERKSYNALLAEHFSHPISPSGEVDSDIAHGVVSSLGLEDARYRFEKIEEAYGSTFEWIWNDPHVGFASWLRNGTGTYWVSGKPGSGKSTLMKYLFKIYKEIALPNAGSSNRTHIGAGFFFHDRGSHLQKSFEGLLHSILHQILSSENGLTKEISHIYSRRPQKHRAKWPIEDLEEAIGCILKQARIPVDILLFLDALDEYGGPPDFIADFIKRMTGAPDRSATQVKICFSSRPWNVFIDQFQECPGFKIHERTKEDIIVYINGKFNESPSMAQLLRQESETASHGSSSLISGLVERAEGVFLWLKLVMDSLLNAVREGALAAELLEILASFPNELEQFYIELVKRIPKEYRMESYAMLEIVLRSEMPINPYDFWLATACAPCSTLGGCVSKIPTKILMAPQIFDTEAFNAREKLDLPARELFCLTVDEVIGGGDQYQRRLKSRCGGLIEEVPYNFGSSRSSILQFMHQTVKDFVSKPGFRQLITNEENEAKENGYSFLVKYGLSQLILERRRSLSPGYSSLLTYVNFTPAWFSYLHYASLAESSTGISQKHLLDAASEAFLPAKSGHDIYALFSSAASFGVVTTLQLYIQEWLEDSDKDMRKLMGYGNYEISTLLHDAVRETVNETQFWPRRDNSYFISPLHPFRSSTYLDYNTSKMTSILLHARSNRFAVYNNETPFQMLFQLPHNSFLGVEDPEITGVALAFLKSGQDPNTEVNTRQVKSSYTPPITCKPLHLVGPSLAQILLEHGADINALDASGCTPMDVRFAALNNLKVAEDANARERLLRLQLLLLEHGGCVTEAGATSVGHFLDILSSSGYPVDRLDNRLKNPPRLYKRAVNANVKNHPKMSSNPSSSSFSSKSNDTSKPSRFKSVLPRLFKRNHS